jgi:hypothetical protein
MIRHAMFVAVPVALTLTTPAVSEGILAALFGFDSAPPPPQYYDHRVLPTMPRPEMRLPPAAGRMRRPKPQIVRLPQADTKPSVARVEQPPNNITPKPVGEVENPLPKLLTDATLRDGDIVVFPDGVRVFKGRAGDKHKLEDFAPITRANVASSTRKLLVAMKIGPNTGWSDDIPSQSKVAARDVEATGSVKKRARR